MSNDYRKNKLNQSGIFRKDADPARQSELYSGVAHERSTHHVFKRMQSGLNSLERRLSLLKTAMHVTVPYQAGITNTSEEAGEHFKKNRSALVYVKKPESRDDVSVAGVTDKLFSIPFRFFAETTMNPTTGSLLHQGLPEKVVLQYSDFFTGHQSEYTKVIPLIEPAYEVRGHEYQPMLYITSFTDHNYFMGGVHHPLTLIVQHNEDINTHGVFPEDPIMIDEARRFTTLRVVCDKATYTADNLLTAINTYSKSHSSLSFDMGALPISASYSPVDVASIPEIVNTVVGDFLLTGADDNYIARLNPAPINVYLKSQTNMFAISTDAATTEVVSYNGNTGALYHKHNPLLYRLKTADTITDPLIAGGNSYDAYFVNTGTYGFIVDEEGIDPPSMGGELGETFYNYAATEPETNARFAYVPENTTLALNDLPSITPANLDVIVADSPLNDIEKGFMGRNPYTFNISSSEDPKAHTISATKNFVIFFTVTDKEIVFTDGTRIHLDEYMDYFALTGDDYYIGIPGTPVFSHATNRLSRVIYDKIDNTTSPVNDPSFTEIPTTVGPVVNKDGSQQPGDGPQIDSLTYISDMFASLIETMNSQRIIATDLIKKSSLSINPETIHATGFVIALEHIGMSEADLSERYLQMGPSKYTISLPVCILGDPGVDATPVYTGAILPTGFINIIKSTPTTPGVEKSHVITDFTAAIKESLLIGYEPATDTSTENHPVTTAKSSVNLDFRYKEDRNGTGQTSTIPVRVSSIGHTTSFDGSADLTAINKLYTFGDALRVETVGTHTDSAATETNPVLNSSVAHSNISLKSTLKFITKAQTSLHDVVSSMFYQPAAGFGNTAPSTDISDTLTDQFSAPFQTTPPPGVLNVDRIKDAISRTENYHSNYIFVGDSTTTEGSSLGRVLRAISPHMAFGSSGSELSQVVASISYVEVKTHTDAGEVVTVTQGDSTTQLIRLRVIEREDIIVTGDETVAPLTDYIKHTPLSDMTTDLIERITVEVPFYLNPQTTARRYSATKRVVAFRSRYDIAISYGVVYDAFSQMTYADFTSYIQKGVTTYPSVIDGGLPFDRLQYVAAPSTDIQTLTLLNPSLMSRVYASGTSHLDTPKPEYSSGAADPATYNYSFFAHNLLDDACKNPVGMYTSLGLLGKNIQPDAVDEHLIKTNPVNIIPFATITLDVIRVEMGNSATRLASYSNTLVPTHETIDAAKYLEKVTILVRNTTSGESTTYDITSDYKAAKIDLGLMNIVHKRSDGLDRLVDASSAVPLIRSVTDQTYSQQYKLGVADKANALSFIPILKYGTNTTTVNSTSGSTYAIGGGGLQVRSPEGNSILSDTTHGSAEAVFLNSSITYDFEEGNMLLFSQDTGGVVTPLTTTGITCRLDDPETLLVVARQIMSSATPTSGGTASGATTVEHQVEDSPINILARLGFAFDIDMTFKDSFVEDLRDDGYLTIGTQIKPDVNTAGDSHGIDVASEIHASGGWHNDATKPYVEIPVSVNIGYLPIFEHTFNGAMPTVASTKTGFTAELGAGGGGDSIKIAPSANAAFMSLLNGPALKKEKTMIRPGKVTIKQTLHRVKMFTKSGRDGSSHDS